jgi:hypothetical protein
MKPSLRNLAGMLVLALTVVWFGEAPGPRTCLTPGARSSKPCLGTGRFRRE